MICVSLAGVSYKSCLKILSEVDMAEIRMDRMKLTQNEIKNLRKFLLLAAIHSGAAYIDLEVNSKTSFIKEIIQEAKKRSCRVILSYHNFKMTPKRKDLIKKALFCFGCRYSQNFLFC